MPFALRFARSASAGGEKQGGFTLAELLVGTAANLLVIAGLFSALGQGRIEAKKEAGPRITDMPGFSPYHLLGKRPQPRFRHPVTRC